MWVSKFRIVGHLREKLASNVSRNVLGFFSPPCHGLAEVYFLRPRRFVSALNSGVPKFRVSCQEWIRFESLGDTRLMQHLWEQIHLDSDD